MRTSCAQLTSWLLLWSIAQEKAALNQLRSETAHQLDLICDAPAHSIHEAKDSKNQYCPCGSVEAAGNYQNWAPMADTSDGAHFVTTWSEKWRVFDIYTMKELTIIHYVNGHQRPTTQLIETVFDAPHIYDHYSWQDRTFPKQMYGYTSLASRLDHYRALRDFSRCEAGAVRIECDIL